jgi:SAM-dependent methyltransferase
VTGIDRDAALLELARGEHGALANLHFELGDATALPYSARFDIVTAARTLQWIAVPGRAIASMRGALKPGGLLVVLDYNHADNAWTPAPPPEFARFYQAFLAWREANGWDNRMGDHLPALCNEAGLARVESSVEDEVAERGSPEFEIRAALWSEVIENLGGEVASAGYCSPEELHTARERYVEWAATGLRVQRLALRAVSGVAL